MTLAPKRSAPRRPVPQRCVPQRSAPRRFVPQRAACLILLAALGLAGCSEPPGEETAAAGAPAAASPADIADGAADPAARIAAEMAALSGDAAAGARVYRPCIACHVIESDRNKVGPHLVGIFGRPVAAVDGYRYSADLQALAADGQIWDTALLSAYLVDPKDVAPGGKMAFAGVRDPQDLADLLAYLARMTRATASAQP